MIISFILSVVISCSTLARALHLRLRTFHDELDERDFSVFHSMFESQSETEFILNQGI